MDVPISEVMRPATMAEALAILAERPEARPLAGGTDLLVQLRDGRRRTDTLVDLGRIGFDRINESDGVLEIGAAARMDTIAEHPRIRHAFPALATAAGKVGAWPIQCRATLGGNLANASPAADTAPALLVADADLLLVASTGSRLVPLDGFFLGPGKTVLAPGELIAAVRLIIPRSLAGSRRIERFVKVGPRREQIISVVSFAGCAVVDDDLIVTELRLAFGSVAPTPLRARQVEGIVLGRRSTPETRREALVALGEDLAPIDDVRAPASYRRIAAAVLLDRFLAEVAHA
jgi:CO/xanthine dehydrogenase FAD-binding subunit